MMNKRTKLAISFGIAATVAVSILAAYQVIAVDQRSGPSINFVAEPAENKITVGRGLFVSIPIKITAPFNEAMTLDLYLELVKADRSDPETKQPVPPEGLTLVLDKPKISLPKEEITGRGVRETAVLTVRALQDAELGKYTYKLVVSKDNGDGTASTTGKRIYITVE